MKVFTIDSTNHSNKYYIGYFYTNINGFINYLISIYSLQYIPKYNMKLKNLFKTPNCDSILEFRIIKLRKERNWLTIFSVTTLCIYTLIILSSFSII